MKAVLFTLLADMFIPGKNFGIASEKTGAGDAFVLMTLGFLFGIFAVVAYAAWRLWQREVKPEPHVRLLMELEQDEETAPAPSAESAPEGKPWEQAADWWKK